MARGFGASESRFSSGKASASDKKLSKALEGIPEVPGILLDNELKALEKTRLVSIKDFINDSFENRENIAKAIQAGIRDFEKNGLTMDDISAEEKDPEAIVEQDRTDRIREQVIEAIFENAHRDNPDARGFGAAESGGFERGFGASLSMPSNKIFADLADKMMESPVLGKQGGALAALDAMMDIKYSRNKDLRDYFREAVESKDPYGLGKATITKLSKLDKQTQNEAARLIACVVGAYSSDRAMSEVYRRLSNEGKIDLMKHDSIDKWEKSAEGDRFSEQLQDEANKQISFILKSIAKNGGQGRISIVA